MKYLHNKNGSSSIILLFMVTIIIGLMTLTVDAGLLYLEKSKLQNTLDSAALAAISVYADGQEKMLEEAIKYAELNGVTADELSIDIQEDNRKVTVRSNKSVSLYFAKIYSISSADVGAKATAMAGSVISTKGIRPFAIEQQEFEYGKLYTLKEGGGEGYSGNYGALALGGTGACNYKSNLVNGYNGSPSLKVGDKVETETGNMTGATKDGIQAILDSDPNDHGEDLSQLEANCPRIIKVPIVDSLEVCGSSKVTIVGFAAFFLEGAKNSGGHTEMNGRFLKKIVEGEIDESIGGYGLVGVKLIE